MEMREEVEEVLRREGGRGRERAVSKVEMTRWREERTWWRVRREVRGSGSVVGLAVGAVKAFDVSSGGMGAARGVAGDIASVTASGGTFSPSGTSFAISSARLSVSASESEVASPRRTSTS